MRIGLRCWFLLSAVSATHRVATVPPMRHRTHTCRTGTENDDIAWTNEWEKSVEKDKSEFSTISENELISQNPYSVSASIFRFGYAFLAGLSLSSSYCFFFHIRYGHIIVLHFAVMFMVELQNWFRNTFIDAYLLPLSCSLPHIHYRFYYFFLVLSSVPSASRCVHNSWLLYIGVNDDDDTK